MSPRSRWLVLFYLTTGLIGLAHAEPGAKLELPVFAALAEKATQTVNVTLDGPVLRMAGRFLNDRQPDEANAKRLLSKLTGVYVRSFRFDDSFAYPKAEIDGVRRQLAAPGWSRVVEARDREQSNDVEIYLRVENSKAVGLAIIASDPRELTLINIVGNIDLEELHQLEGKFGIPKVAPEPRSSR